VKDGPWLSLADIFCLGLDLARLGKWLLARWRGRPLSRLGCWLLARHRRRLSARLGKGLVAGGLEEGFWLGLADSFEKVFLRGLAGAFWLGLKGDFWLGLDDEV